MSTHAWVMAVGFCLIASAGFCAPREKGELVRFFGPLHGRIVGAVVGTESISWILTHHDTRRLQLVQTQASSNSPLRILRNEILPDTLLDTDTGDALSTGALISMATFGSAFTGIVIVGDEAFSCSLRLTKPNIQLFPSLLSGDNAFAAYNLSKLCPVYCGERPPRNVHGDPLFVLEGNNDKSIASASMLPVTAGTEPASMDYDNITYAIKSHSTIQSNSFMAFEVAEMPFQHAGLVVSRVTKTVGTVFLAPYKFSHSVEFDSSQYVQYAKPACMKDGELIMSVACMPRNQTSELSGKSQLMRCKFDHDKEKWSLGSTVAVADINRCSPTYWCYSPSTKRFYGIGMILGGDDANGKKPTLALEWGVLGYGNN